METCQNSQNLYLLQPSAIIQAIDVVQKVQASESQTTNPSQLASRLSNFDIRGEVC